MGVASAEQAAEKKTTAIDQCDIAAALRAQALQVSAADLQLQPPPAVHGVVIDTAYPDRVVSVAAFADGSASWYVSDGSGCIGCGSHSDVRRAAADLLRIAEGQVAGATTASDHAPPAIGNVQFFFLTTTGVRAVQTPLDEVTRSDSPLATMYFAGLRLVQVAEDVGAGQSLKREIDHALAERTPENGRQAGTERCSVVGNAARRLRS